MIFPTLGPEYLDETDRTMRQRMETFYAQAITINASYWGESDTDLRFYLGDQSLWNDLYGNLPSNRRRQFNFNRIMRIVNMISGYERRNRTSMVATPVSNADEETADQITKLLMWANNKEDILETVSEAFQAALITGMSFLHVWMDYREDPVNGTPRVDLKYYNSMIMDPYFRKHDLSDCNALWTRTFVSKREALSLLPNKSEELATIVGLDSRDGKFQFLPESFNYGLKGLLTYDEFYYRDFREQRCLVDTRTGELQEWRGHDDEKLREFLRLFPEITVINNTIPTVKLAILCQGKVMYDGPTPDGADTYPLIPVFAYYHPESPYYPWRIQGVVRGLRDAQYLYNRRKIVELDILESQISSGWKYKEDALVNPNDVFLQGQGKGLALKKSALMTDVERIQAPDIPQSMIQLSESLGAELQQISGVNEELLGSAIDDKAGILSALRQGAGLTTLQTLFDQLNKSKKLLGNALKDRIQYNFTPGKVQSILQAQPAPQFYNKAFGRYDIVIEEGLNTTTQKQMQFAQLLQLREVGVQVPDDVLLDACTLQNKKQLREAVMANQQQAAQMQQMQLNTQMQEQQARTELAQARAIADRGLGLERVSRIQENEALAVERQAAAKKDEEQALLNLVKSLKEIEGADLDQLHKLVELSRLVQPEEINPRMQPVQTTTSPQTPVSS